MYVYIYIYICIIYIYIYSEREREIDSGRDQRLSAYRYTSRICLDPDLALDKHTHIMMHISLYISIYTHTYIYIYNTTDGKQKKTSTRSSN